ncbi:MFS transporter [Streptomyces sp. 71268]|uniref:MFS transporter n=1 Tax=Streptomyces sp. 71268 TaxID=3002640 RepID=UPI0023F80B2B|nr:MFS transporter [Streptomyces sp. 71268]WEV25171.1 MFS transporter [Streptomyces sp. 71268]
MVDTTARAGQTSTGAPISRVLPLALATFAAGTDDMVIAGVLPDIAADLHVSEANAGQLVTAFALTYGIGTPLVAVLTARFPRRGVLLGGLGAFVALNLLASLAPSYGALLALRVLAAVAAAAITPAALAMAATMAPDHRRGRYLGLVIGGLTVSLVAGVPLGTWIGGGHGWRATMLFVAGLGALAWCGALAVPRTLADGADTGPGGGATGAGAERGAGLRGRLAPLRQRPVLGVLLMIVVAASGGMMQMTYVFPVLRAAGHGIGHDDVALTITLMGCAGAVAAWLGGRGADQWGPRPTVVAAELGHGAALLAVAALAWAGDMPYAAIASAMMLVALFAWSLTPPLQMLLLTLAPGAGMEVLALQTSALFLGASLGGVLGGLLLAHGSAAAIPLAGGLLQFAGLALLPRRRGA